MIPKLRQLLPVLLILTGAVSCRYFERSHWTDTLPASAPLVIIPSAHTSLSDYFERDEVVWLDLLTPARLSDIQSLRLDSMGVTTVRALVVVPAGSRNWTPLWIMDLPQPERLRLPDPVNRYRFRQFDITTHRFGNARLHGATVGSTLILSESSTAVEEALLAASTRGNGFPIETKSLKPGTMLVQLSKLYQIAGLETLVEAHGPMREMLAGLPSVTLEVTLPDRAFGTMRFGNEPLHPVMSGLTGLPATSLLAGYIPADALIAAEFLGLPKMTSDATLEDFRRTFDTSYGYTGIASGDAIWIRIIRDPSGAATLLNRLVQRGDLTPERDGYRVRNPDLANLATSGIVNRPNLWIRLSGNALYLADNPGAVARVVADRSRDRVLANDEHYRLIRDNMPGPWGGFVMVRENGLAGYLREWLQPDHRLSTYMNSFDAIAVAFRGDGIRSVDVDIRLFRFGNTRKPVIDGWSTNLDGYGTSGPPTLADITGDGRHDVVVTTTGGRLYAFGSDGVELFNAGMDVESVMGSPTVADWFGNSDPAILIGADNRIYAWQRNGAPLPTFPLELEHRLSAPITVVDLTGRNVTELIVATMDQTVSRLDRRGRPMPGWPRPMADIATERPFAGRIWDRRLIIACADDRLYAWDLNGVLQPGFPIGLPSAGTGALRVFGDHLLLGTLTGDLVAIGRTAAFPGLPQQALRDSWVLQRVRTGTSSLRLAPIDGDWIAGVGQEGQIRVYDKAGTLRYADELFVTMNTSEPVWVDLNQDGHKDLVATSIYGRVYAWDIVNRRKIDALPAITTYDPSFSTSFGPDAMPYMVSDTPTGIRVWRLQGTVNGTGPGAPNPDR